LVLVEGFKAAAFPKIELHRPSLGKPLIHPSDPNIVAFACDDEANTHNQALPKLALMTLKRSPPLSLIILG